MTTSRSTAGTALLLTLLTGCAYDAVEPPPPPEGKARVAVMVGTHRNAIEKRDIQNITGLKFAVLINGKHYDTIDVRNIAVVNVLPGLKQVEIRSIDGKAEGEGRARIAKELRSGETWYLDVDIYSNNCSYLNKGGSTFLASFELFAAQMDKGCSYTPHISEAFRSYAVSRLARARNAETLYGDTPSLVPRGEISSASASAVGASSVPIQAAANTRPAPDPASAPKTIPTAIDVPLAAPPEPPKPDHSASIRAAIEKHVAENHAAYAHYVVTRDPRSVEIAKIDLPDTPPKDGDSDWITAQINGTRRIQPGDPPRPFTLPVRYRLAKTGEEAFAVHDWQIAR